LSRNIIYRDTASTYRQWLDWQQNAIAINSLSCAPKAAGKSSTFQLIVRTTSTDSDNALLLTLTDIKRQTAANWHCHILTHDNGRDSIEVLLKSLFPDTSRFSCTGKLDLPTANKDSIVCFIYPGERLRETCLNSVSRWWSPETKLLYTDHDQISADGNHLNPWFTFSWSPDLLLSTNYIGGVYFIDGELLTPDVAASAAKAPNNAAWRYNLLLTLSQAIPSSTIHRLAEVLWSEPELTVAEKEQLFSDETTAVKDALNQNPQMVDAEVIHNELTRYVSWPLKAQPKVSIIIPTTGKMRFLKPCLDTLASTDYANLEIVILDNSRGDHSEGIQYARDAGTLVIECDEAFNWSRLNNIGARQGSGDVLLFLNDDIEIIHPDWLTELVRQVMRDDIGTVGCMLLYPNGAIQHAGVFLVDHGGGARHLFHKQLPGKGIYQQLDQCVREVSASTGACLMIRRDRFEQLGGFDENLSIVGNDIDLCLRALEAGYRNIWTPHSRLIHHESVSRQNKPIGQDEKSMWKRWEHRFTAGDPYYNPALSLLREDCVIAEIPVKTIKEPKLTSADVTTSTYGVNLIAYIRASMGVGEAARGNAAALEASGIPFGIINYEHGNPSKMDNLRWQHREVASPEYSINLVHINADHLPSVIKDLSLEKSKNRYNIGFWAWELPEFPDRWLSSFEHLDEIWVPSNFVNRAIAAKSPVPVVTIPHVVNIDFASASVYQRSDFGIEREAFVFITMFDIHSIAQRKNPYGAILAFKTAFAADDKRVQLVIKINNADEASLRVLQSHIGAHKNILLIGQHLDRSGIDSLINCVDCYVSLHHSEGFGLGPAEAMALGKATILTNWSGNLEYMRRDNCLAVDYQLKVLGRDYGPYEAHQHWAVPDIDHAAKHMRTLASNPDLAKTIGTFGRLTIETEFSAQAIGASMKLRLQNIARFMEK
jgi:GT2 family glycosyltransferase